MWLCVSVCLFVYSVSTTQLAKKFDLIGGTTAQGTTAPGDNRPQLSHSESDLNGTKSNVGLLD